MQISAINNCCPKPQFTANKNNYENPINRKTEKNLAVWTSIGSSTLVGGTAAAHDPFLIGKATKNRGWMLRVIGAAAALTTIALTLPPKL